MASAVQHGPALTYEHYRLLPDDGQRYELIEGHLFVSPAPSPWHQTVSRRLQHALMTQLEDTGLALVFDAPVDLLLEPPSVVQPDLVVLASARKHLVTARAIEGVPDVVVEILSPGSLDRDTHIKRNLYQRFGVCEYWIVDPQRALIELWRLDEDRYGLRAKLDATGTLTCPEFPALAIPLAAVFAR